MLFRAIMIAALAAGIPVTVHAQNKQFQYYGFPGNDSCGSWTDHRKNRDNQILEGWVLGFVTGANFFGQHDGRLGEGLGATAMFAWVDQYCAANPLDSVLQASIKLIVELKKRRGIRN